MGNAADVGGGPAVGLTSGERAKMAFLENVKKNKFASLPRIVKDHPQYVLAKCVADGIKTVLKKDQKNSPTMTVSKGKKAQEEAITFKIPMKVGGNWTTFDFTAFGDKFYKSLRRKFQVEGEFKTSFDRPFQEFKSNSKSGAYFFFTNDGKYLVKTIKESESRALRNILPQYHHHMTFNEDSILNKILGLYRIQFPRPFRGHSTFNIVVLESLFGSNRFVHKIYDLKGSFKGRTAKEEDIQRAPNERTTNAILMDNDLRAEKKGIMLRPDVAAKIKKQILSDTDWLKSQGMVDYSLIVGIWVEGSIRIKIPRF
uniref:PIPK domain-containing protein n=1 Tax=Lotharella oceanica TaxID=641309 RepID=A0A7S2TZG0_9EUKA